MKISRRSFLPLAGGVLAAAAIPRQMWAAHGFPVGIQLYMVNNDLVKDSATGWQPCKIQRNLTRAVRLLKPTRVRLTHGKLNNRPCSHRLEGRVGRRNFQRQHDLRPRSDQGIARSRRTIVISGGG